MIPTYNTIDEARKAGIPSLGFARDIENARNDILRALTINERMKAREKLDEVIKSARSVQRLRVFITVASALFGTLTLVAFMFAIWYGYSTFLQPLGLPETTPFTIFTTILVVKYAWKGLGSNKAVREFEFEMAKEKEMLWLDVVKQNSKTHAHNLGGAGLFALLVFGLSFFV